MSDKETQRELGELKGLMTGMSDLLKDHIDRSDKSRGEVIDVLKDLQEKQDFNTDRIDELERKWGVVSKVGKWLAGVLGAIVTALGITWFNSQMGGK